MREVWDKLMVPARQAKELLDVFVVIQQWEFLYWLCFVWIHLNTCNRYNVTQELKGSLEKVLPL